MNPIWMQDLCSFHLRQQPQSLIGKWWFYKKRYDEIMHEFAWNLEGWILRTSSDTFGIFWFFLLISDHKVQTCILCFHLHELTKVEQTQNDLAELESDFYKLFPDQAKIYILKMQSRFAMSQADFCNIQNGLTGHKWNLLLLLLLLL